MAYKYKKKTTKPDVEPTPEPVVVSAPTVKVVAAIRLLTFSAHAASANFGLSVDAVKSLKIGCEITLTRDLALALENEELVTIIKED